MKKPVKIFIGAMWGIAALFVVGALSLWFATRPSSLEAMATAETGMATRTAEHYSPPMEMPSYDFTDETGKTFQTEKMKGNVWVADFIFTRCTGPCPMMTSHMAGLQKELAGKPVRFVSFSVDPEYDTPQVLEKYAADHGANLSNWSFVTGKQSDIFALARSMLIGVSAAEGKMPIAHSVKFLLINRAGHITGYYDGNDPAQMKDLARDAAALAGA